MTRYVFALLGAGLLAGCAANGDLGARAQTASDRMEPTSVAANHPEERCSCCHGPDLYTGSYNDSSPKIGQ